MIRSSNLTYSYDGQKTISFPDIDIDQGGHFLILGNSGCGKTTLLHLLSGLLTAKQGKLTIADTALNSLSSSKKDDFRGRNIGIVFQTPHFIDAINVEENLMLAQKMAGLKTDRSRVNQILDNLNIAHKAKSKPSNLSQGERQRVSIARAVVNNPKVIFADEPTSALDDHNCEEVLRLLENQANSTKATLVIVTHDGRLKDHFTNKIILKSL